MSVYRDRTGQCIGDLEVVADHGRTKRGAVLWECRDHATWQTLYLRTYEVIALDRRYLVGVTP